jgi:hypothetical protein
MKSQSLLDKGTNGGRERENRPPAWIVSIGERPGWTKTPNDANEREAKWQKHVVVLLWVCLALVITIGSALIYAKGHGLLKAGPNRETPLPAPWPDLP